VSWKVCLPIYLIEDISIIHRRVLTSHVVPDAKESGVCSVGPMFWVKSNIHTQA